MSIEKKVFFFCLCPLSVRHFVAVIIAGARISQYAVNWYLHQRQTKFFNKLFGKYLHFFHENKNTINVILTTKYWYFHFFRENNTMNRTKNMNIDNKWWKQVMLVSVNSRTFWAVIMVRLEYAPTVLPIQSHFGDVIDLDEAVVVIYSLNALNNKHAPALCKHKLCKYIVTRCTSDANTMKWKWHKEHHSIGQGFYVEFYICYATEKKNDIEKLLTNSFSNDLRKKKWVTCHFVVVTLTFFNCKPIKGAFYKWHFEREWTTMISRKNEERVKKETPKATQTASANLNKLQAFTVSLLSNVQWSNETIIMVMFTFSCTNYLTQLLIANLFRLPIFLLLFKKLVYIIICWAKYFNLVNTGHHI